MYAIRSYYGHPYDMCIGYPAVIGYIYRPFRDVYAYARNPVNRGNEPGNRVFAIPANHIIYYKRCLPDVFTPRSSAALKQTLYPYYKSLYLLLYNEFLEPKKLSLLRLIISRNNFV